MTSRKRPVPDQVARVQELRRSSTARPVPGQRRRDPRVRGGRAGLRRQLRSKEER